MYDVTDADGKHVAVFMTDYYTRPSKRQGAWMSEFKGSFVTDDGKVERPIVYNVANFTRPTGNTPCLLSLDEVETMFHEFGHGLHGMLTRAKYKSQAEPMSTATSWSFPRRFTSTGPWSLNCSRPTPTTTRPAK